jgi:hypothetical protein
MSFSIHRNAAGGSEVLLITVLYYRSRASQATGISTSLSLVASTTVSLLHHSHVSRALLQLQAIQERTHRPPVYIALTTSLSIHLVVSPEPNAEPSSSSTGVRV